MSNTANFSRDSMHIALCSDSNYVMPMGVTMISICENNRDVKIVFHLVITDEGENNEERKRKLSPLQEIADKYQKVINFYRIGKSQLVAFKCTGVNYISTTAFARIFLPEILSVEIHRVIYMDCDIAVDGSLLPLWQTEMLEDCPLGAVIDANSQLCEYRLKIPKGISYYNSGILLMNLDVWRKESLIRKMVDCATAYTYPLLDQDVINVVLQGRIHSLPVTYNFQLLFYFNGPEVWYVTADIKEEIRKTLEKPVVIHYLSPNKPWCDEYCPHREVWERYSDLSPWRGLPKRPVSTLLQRSRVYQPLVDAWWSDQALVKEFLPVFIELINASVRLKNKRLFVNIATKPMKWMTWILRKAYAWKTRNRK